MSGWNDYSVNAKWAVHYAEKEARKRNQPVMPEHLLLGILQVEGCAAMQALHLMEIDVDAVRETLIKRMPPAADPTIEQEQTTCDKRSTKIFEYAFHEARHLRSLSIRSEHLLMAILYERWGTAKFALKKNGVRMGHFHQALYKLRTNPLPKIPLQIELPEDTMVRIAVGVAESRWSQYPKLSALAKSWMKQEEVDPSLLSDQDIADLRAEVTKLLLSKKPTS